MPAYFTKPCARSGCLELVTQPQRALLRKRQYHSRACFYAATKGQLGAHLTPAICAAGGKKGGRVRRAQAVRRQAEAVASMLPRELLEDLELEHRLRLTVLVGRVYRRGYDQGRKEASRRRMEA